MTIETKTNDYKSHKYKRTVYVDVNPKTQMGKKLLNQYHEQSKYHYMDIGRIGYHNEYGKYIIDNYTIRELLVVPKLIIRVIEHAMNRAGKDVYQLRTYMSKFGQLNFLLLVDKDYADLILVENIYLENLNYKENYETQIWRLNYYNSKPVPLADIFYKFGIKANPDDYGKSWKEEVKINNIISAKAKAEFSIKLANQIGHDTNQKALITSLNYLNKEGKYGKKISKAYSEAVSKEKEINKMGTSARLENTLNCVLIKTIEEHTTKKDLKDIESKKVYDKVVNVQFASMEHTRKEVEKSNNKEGLKGFLLDTYKKPEIKAEEKEEKENIKKQTIFERIIKTSFPKDHVREESFLKNEEKLLDLGKNKLPNEFKDFENKKVNINLDLSRFEKEETKESKKNRLKKEKIFINKIRKTEKLEKKSRKKLISKPIQCDINKEYEDSKTYVGVKNKLNKSKKLNLFFSKKKVKENSPERKEEKEEILNKIEKRIKKQNARIEKKNERINKLKLVKEKKKKKRNEIENIFDNKSKKENQNSQKGFFDNTNSSRPVVKPKEEKENSQNSLNKQEILNYISNKNKENNEKKSALADNNELNIKMENQQNFNHQNYKMNDSIKNNAQPKKKEKSLEM